MAKKKAANTGHRLTPQQKRAIANAADDVTNTELAEKYGTTPVTIAKYRNGGASAAKAEAAVATPTPAKYGRKASTTAPAASPRAAKGVTVELDGAFVVIRAPRGNELVKGLVNQLLS